MTSRPGAAGRIMPDVFWKLLAALSERHSRKGSGGMQTDLLPCPNATRDGFLGAYKSTQAEVQPRVDLQNPTPRTYMALHVRRRLRFTDELLNSTRVAIGSIFRANGLPWLFLAQSAAMAEGARRSLLAIGVRIVDRSVVGGMSMEQELLRGALKFPCPAALACTRTHTHTHSRFPLLTPCAFATCPALRLLRYFGCSGRPRGHPLVEWYRRRLSSSWLVAMLGG